MKYPLSRYLVIAALAVAFASLGTTVGAQTYTGRIDVIVEDSTGGAPAGRDGRTHRPDDADGGRPTRAVRCTS